MTRLKIRDYHNCGQKRLQRITNGTIGQKHTPTPLRFHFYCIFINKYFSDFQILADFFFQTDKENEIEEQFPAAAKRYQNMERT